MIDTDVTPDATSTTRQESYKKMKDAFTKTVPDNPEIEREKEAKEQKKRKYGYASYRKKQPPFAMLYLTGLVSGNKHLKMSDVGILLKMTELLPMNQTVCASFGKPLTRFELQSHLGIQSSAFSDFQLRATKAGIIRIDKKKNATFPNEYHINPSFSRRGKAHEDQKNLPFIKFLLEEESTIQKLSNKEAGFLYYVSTMMHRDHQLLSPVPDEGLIHHTTFHNHQTLQAEMKNRFQICSPKTVRKLLTKLIDMDLLKIITFDNQSLFVLNPMRFQRAPAGGSTYTMAIKKLYEDNHISSTLKRVIMNQR